MQALEHLLGRDRARQALSTFASIIATSSAVVAEALQLLSSNFGEEAALEMGVRYPQILTFKQELLEAKIQYICGQIEGAKAALVVTPAVLRRRLDVVIIPRLQALWSGDEVCCCLALSTVLLASDADLLKWSSNAKTLTLAEL